MGFTAGQQAYSDFFELTLESARVVDLQNKAVERGMSCHRINEGRLNICYVICTQYNYWEGCTSHPGVSSPLTNPKVFVTSLAESRDSLNRASAPSSASRAAPYLVRILALMV